MKNNILYTIAILILFLPTQNFAQAPNLSTAADFALFTSNGAVQNVGIFQVTGNVDTNTASNIGFSNVNGASGQCAADLLFAYNHSTGCAILGTSTNYDITDESIAVYQNPFHSSITIALKEVPTSNKYQFIVFNALREQITNTPLYQKSTHLELNNLPVGIYFYKVIANNKVLQSGKLVAL